MTYQRGSAGRGTEGYSYPGRTTSPNRAFERALIILGGQSEMARQIGVSQQTVSVWTRTGRIPAERVLTIEQITNGMVTRYDLRPDLYPRSPPPRKVSS